MRMSSGIVDAGQRIGPLPERPDFVTLGERALPVVGAARIYVCGITPYDVTHVGHAATFVWADVLAAVLGSTAIQTTVCRNITDVDDVLIDAARAKGRYYDEFALSQEAVFDHSMTALQVAAPAAQPRARHYTDAVQQLAQALLDTGAAYERDGTVWFRGHDVPARAGYSHDEALRLSAAYGDDPGSRAKDDPFDVPVWQSSVDGTPAWASPWGWGRPGWHAECAAMAMAVHGSTVDVLVGGEDLTFPHHAYQEAMVSAVTGVTPFARAVVHVGEVRVEGSKMAKSTGNLVLVDELLESCTPAALRLLLLGRPYAQAWDFEHDGLDDAERRLQRLYEAAARPTDSDPAGVVAALRTDLDVPAALALAEEQGGEAARRAIAILKLG